MRVAAARAFSRCEIFQKCFAAADLSGGGSSPFRSNGINYKKPFDWEQECKKNIQAKD